MKIEGFFVPVFGYKKKLIIILNHQLRFSFQF